MKAFCVSFIALMVVSAFVANGFAQEKPKGGKGNPANQIVAQFMKQLEKAELNDEQTTKVKELMTNAAKEAVTKRTDGGITPEMMKKRAEVSKTAKESGKKGKELKVEVDSASGFSAEQNKAFDEAESILSKARIEVGKLLTAEQFEKLPAAFQTNLKEKAVKKKKQDS